MRVSPTLSLSAAVIMLAAAAAHGAPAPRHAASGPNMRELMSRKVTLRLVGVPSLEAVRRLCDQAGANWVARGPIGSTVTLSLTKVPFQAALARVLRMLERTYTIRDGVPYIEPMSDGGFGTGFLPLRGVVVVAVNYITAADAVRVVRATPGARTEDGVDVEPDPRGNCVLVRALTYDQVREVKEILRLVDRPAERVEVRAECVLTFAGRSERGRHHVIATTGRSRNAAPLHMAATLGSATDSRRGRTLTSGRSGLRIVPHVNGDGSVTMGFLWNLAMTWRTRGSTALRVVRRSVHGAMLVGSGRTRLAAEARWDTPDGTVIDARVFLTPRRLGTTDDDTYGSYPSTVLALDFTDRAGVGEGSGSAAADATAQALADCGRYDVVVREEVRKAAEKLGLRPPFSEGAVRDLTDSLWAQFVVTGDILPIASAARAGGGAVLPIAVRAQLRDARHGDLLAQATVVASAAAGASAPSGTDVVSAVRRAATEAGRRMASARPRYATVIATSPDDAEPRSVVLNGGRREGVRQGMSMAVYRGKARIATIEVRSSDEHSSVAAVQTHDGPVQVEDRASMILAPTASAGRDLGPAQRSR